MYPVKQYKKGRNFVIDIGQYSIKRVELTPIEYESLADHFSYSALNKRQFEMGAKWALKQVKEKMKDIVVFVALILLVSSCQVECPDDCLEVTTTGTVTSFALNDPPEPGNYYYLSLNNESQGIVNVQFPPAGSVYYPDTLECQIYHLFVFDTDNVSTVHQAINNFYNSIDTTMIYYCAGIVGCE